MAGIYIHVPFCRKQCSYCDFYKSLSDNLLPEYLTAAGKELRTNADYLNDKNIKTVYFGGGTPSILSARQINKLFNNIQKYFKVERKAEITLEANPDDLSAEYISELKNTPINRLSIGIQSFNDNELKFMNRRHNAQQAKTAIRQLQESGCENISGDLIYGIPGSNTTLWEQNLKTFFDMGISHLSAYHLSFEAGTEIYKMRKKSYIKEASDEESAAYFRILSKESRKAGYEHYEVSNFAKPGCRSRHNSAYWSDEEYLGIGPSAHSYNGSTRLMNVPDIRKYLQSISENRKAGETEVLSRKDLFNEFIMKALRTSDGIYLPELQKRFSLSCIRHYTGAAQKYLQAGILQSSENRHFLKPESFFISDGIISDFFLV